MEIVDVLSRWVHVGTAIVLAGGLAFQYLILRRSAAALPEESRAELMTGVMSIWKRFVHAGIGLLLLSGLYNFMRAIPAHRGDGMYHQLLGIKILIALGVFVLASLLVGRTRLAERLRAKAASWQGFLLILLGLIVAISGYVKVRGVPDQTANAPSAAVAEGEAE